ncbi:MAG: hypothetical protein KJ970_14825 [Candidatus Eisenbacteria bacterium]|uniref:Glycosyltransferase RgtA/B/C/D-like domain-containing protein n=1 Tax=Eiseniibacteriota bacterium TaxID=2212470 RepID=A0A948RWA5_UNCEI|nr:hypothetical protein [Candidatus Eisenbacteria bacterium]MBU1950934.1 hypothetical protein [Candidatus Eisenbacteria bacterium]MBU2692193.1 hypothetical protein [Candidatus Eisenbacteria bacterium]
MVPLPGGNAKRGARAGFEDGSGRGQKIPAAAGHPSRMIPDYLERFDRNAVLWGLVFFGILLRILQYIADPSLWLDESMLALNLIHRDFSGLRAPLDYEQAAPLLFLYLERCAVIAWGKGGMALRAVPFISGVAVMPLGLLTIRRLLPKGTWAFGLLLLAVSDPLIDYSCQLKPYALDAAAALLVIYLVLRLIQNKRAPIELLLLGGLGIIGPWLSYPLIFVMPMGFAVLFLAKNTRGDRLRIMGAVGAVLLWISSLLGLFVYLSGWASVSSLQGVWARSGGFAPFPPSSAEDLLWYARSAYLLFRMPGGLLIPIAGLILMIPALINLIRTRAWALSVLLLGPLFLALLASGFALYPFSGRLLLFLSPSLIFLLALGFSEVAAYLRSLEIVKRGKGKGKGKALAFTALFILLAGATVGVETMRACYGIIRPRGREEVREMVSFLVQRAHADDLVYVYYASALPFEFYCPDPPCPLWRGIKARANPELYYEDLDEMPRQSRVWIFLSHLYNWGDLDEGRLILDHLEEKGLLLEQHLFEGGQLALFDLSGGSAEPHQDPTK